MNLIVIDGHLGRDPELRFIAGSGKAVANFSMAVERPFSKEKTSDWFNIVVWGKPAENVANYLHKGSKVLVKGYTMTRSYEDKEGVKRYVSEVVADTVEFLDPKPKAGEPHEQQLGDINSEGFQSIEDDDPYSIPF